MGIASQAKYRLPGLPTPLSNASHGFHHPASDTDQQSKSEIGRGIGQHARRMADHDAQLGGCLHINGVVTDGMVTDRPKVRGSIHLLGIYGIRQQTEETLRLFCLCQEYLLGQRQLTFAYLRFSKATQQLQAPFGYQASHVDFGTHVPLHVS